MSRTAIYTAIFGGYDTLKPQEPVPGVDFHCFTDDPSMSSDVWSIHLQKPRFEHPRMAAKYYKALPHEVLSNYRMSIWIDGGIALRRPWRFVRMARRTVKGHGLALFAHPVRADIASEAEVSLTMPKYEGLPLAEQVKHYESEGFGDDVGLYAGGVLARVHSDHGVRRFGELWLEENKRWSYQDQLSMPYVLWKCGLTPATFPFDLWKNPFLKFGAHASEL